MPTFEGENYLVRCAMRAASERYWRAKGCSKWKAEELWSRYGFRPAHRAFYRAPR